MMKFRHKGLAALLASAGGGLGLHGLYLGRSSWWLPLVVTIPALSLLIGVRNWYQSPPFFAVMVPVVAGFIEALFIALMPDERFDARFNPGSERCNRSGWDAVLVAVATLFFGAIALMATIALLTQTVFESLQGPPG